ncbi:hypothetical protein [Amycolatopsis dongchuanensis]|uniref:Methyltransferase domain-containing protein n=1 Tax=Amycolatopsis dongchuanensis TaxID=1070866 RepID=A0ABP9Q8E0_9PSEU
MTDIRMAEALDRLTRHYELHLPPRRTDLLGRLVLRFLWRRQLKWQVETNLAIRDALRVLDEERRAQRSELEGLADRSGLVGIEQLTHEVAQLRQSDQNLTAGFNQRLYSAVGRLQSELSDLRLRLTESAEHTDSAVGRLKALEEQVEALGATARELRLRSTRLDLLLGEHPSARPDESEGAAPQRDSFLELAVAELLDGPAEHVRTARQAYLPLITEAREAGATGPVLDMAPVRGEWLELLRNAGVPYEAMSTNGLVRRHCGELGLAVGEGDPLHRLAAAPPRSLGAITAFRYAERLDPDSLARFVNLAATALQPGGVLIVETPTTGAAAPDFHLDPFARRPVHPVFLRFLADSAGFARTETRYPQPGPLAGWPAEAALTADRTTDRYCLFATR